ncbi:TlpA family protein disulfide reductase [Algibacter sp. Ld11]|uniref:TlpA family protein disulfide reductase n=1 Tax=Algibacter sp. Ld11 TaxID=649150 RepID=UPI00386AFBA9
MKKIALYILSISLFTSACANKDTTPLLNTCKIQIHVDGTSTGIATIAPYQRVQSMEEYNKFTIKDSIKGKTSTIEIDTVQALRKVTLNYNNKMYSTKLFTGVGEYILTIKNDSLIVKGAPRHEEFLKINETLGISKMEDLKYKKNLTKVEDDFKTNFSKNLIETIKKHPKNTALAQTAYGQFWAEDVATLDKVLNSFDQSMHANYFLTPLVERRKNLDIVTVGKPAPIFTLKSYENKDISISDYKGKYLLIDFWAYWCAPCIKGFPELKEIRKSYPEDKLAILSISTDKNYDKWIEAVDKHKLPWTQVIDDAKLPVDISSKYVVTSIPHLLLISPEGNIIYKHKYTDNLTDELKKILN